MIALDVHAPTDSATQFPAARITAATLTRATGALVLSYTNSAGVPQQAVIANGQDGPDLMAALTSLKSTTLTTV